MPPPAGEGSWRDSWAFLIAALLILGPLAIPLIWLHRRPPLLMKLGLTLLAGFGGLYLAHVWYEWMHRIKVDF